MWEVVEIVPWTLDGVLKATITRSATDTLPPLLCICFLAPQGQSLSEGLAQGWEVTWLEEGGKMLYGPLWGGSWKNGPDPSDKFGRDAVQRRIAAELPFAVAACTALSLCG